PLARERRQERRVNVEHPPFPAIGDRREELEPAREADEVGARFLARREHASRELGRARARLDRAARNAEARRALDAAGLARAREREHDLGGQAPGARLDDEVLE